MRADRLLGTADARVRTEGRGAVLQTSDTGDHDWFYRGPIFVDEAPGVEELGSSLGSRRPTTPISTTPAFLILDQRRIMVTATVVDLADPLARGLFQLTDGELSNGPGQVVVNDALMERGVAMPRLGPIRSCWVRGVRSPARARGSGPGWSVAEK